MSIVHFFLHWNRSDCISAISAIFTAIASLTTYYAVLNANQIAIRSSLLEVVTRVISRLPTQFFSTGNALNSIYPNHDAVFRLHSEVKILTQLMGNRKISKKVRTELAEYFWVQVPRSVQEEIAYGMAATEVCSTFGSIKNEWLASDRAIVCDFFAKTVEKYEGQPIKNRLLTIISRQNP